MRAYVIPIETSSPEGPRLVEEVVPVPKQGEVVIHVFPFEEAREAITCQASAAPFGKVVIVID